MAKSERHVWYGDGKNGIEIRHLNGTNEVDEILLYVDGRLAFHLEQISPDTYWLGIQAAGHTVHAHAVSSVGTSIRLMADGWEEDNLSNADDETDPEVTAEE